MDLAYWNKPDAARRLQAIAQAEREARRAPGLLLLRDDPAFRVDEHPVAQAVICFFPPTSLCDNARLSLSDRIQTAL